MGFAELWRWQGTMDRGKYALAGVGAAALKFALDRFVAVEVFHRQWVPWFYIVAPWRPNVIGTASTKPWVQSTGSTDAATFAAVMMAIALPFIWLGVTLTVQRLRDAGQPLWLVVLFFVPLLNLLFFLILCMLRTNPAAPARQAAPWPETKALDSWIPRSKLGAGLASILVTAVIGLVFTIFSTAVLKTYGLGLFLALPFCLGLFSTLLYSYHEPRSAWQCLVVSTVPIAVLGVVLLIVAIEGVICILMAGPFAAGLATLGGMLGYAIQAGYWSTKGAPAMLSVVLLFAPSVVSVERLVHPEPQMFSVKSAVEVKASPGKVWKEVVSFGEIAPPTEMIFRAGIAYPMRAKMLGSGVGAVRRCEFSTGAFVEPIEVWDAPRLLRFGVSENPPPMREITPYAKIEPAHLHGYFVSHQGQFLLTELPGGRTRLEGTTWYTAAMWPQAYWHWWSDYIIHRIHMRVLEHIRSQVEAQ